MAMQKSPFPEENPRDENIPMTLSYEAVPYHSPCMSQYQYHTVHTDPIFVQINSGSAVNLVPVSFLDQNYHGGHSVQEPFSYFQNQFPLPNRQLGVIRPQIPQTMANHYEAMAYNPIMVYNPAMVDPFATMGNSSNLYGGWGQMDAIYHEPHLDETHGSFLCPTCGELFVNYESHLGSHCEGSKRFEGVKSEEAFDRAIGKKPVDSDFERDVGKITPLKGVVIKEAPQ